MLHDLNNTDKHRLIPIVVMGGQEVTMPIPIRISQGR